MEEAIRLRAFEPFSIPKQKNKGSGLSLALVYSIIKQSSGDVCLTSELGKGTSFRIFLPRA
jgi:two-component system cell cycle sensor histidine kinase/response regulator CckA